MSLLFSEYFQKSSLMLYGQHLVQKAYESAKRCRDYRDDSYTNEEIVSLLTCNVNNDAQALLGPNFRPELPSQPLQPVDLTFIDSLSALHANNFSMEE